MNIQLTAEKEAQMQTFTMLVDPITAARMLKSSGGNRPLKEAKVAAYTRDMIEGRWMVNGESIIFSDDGELMDGHHRLTACVKSGRPFSTVIVEGVQSGARKTIDMGASRTIGDALSFNGYKNSNQLNSTILAIMSLEKGRPRSANPSSSEVFDFIAKWPEVVGAGAVAARKHMPRAQAICGAIWFVAKINGEENKADAFLSVLSSGIPSGKGCAAHVLRERIIRDSMSAKKMSVQDIHRLCVAAWEKFRRDDNVKSIKIPSDFKITGWPK